MIVLFDLDGVLFESRDMHFRTLNQALAERNLPTISAYDHSQTYNGRPTAEKLRLLGIPIAEQVAVRERKQVLTLEWVSKLTTDSRLVGIFSDLKRRDHLIGVCSNSVRATTESALRALGLRGFCNIVLSNQDVERPKPHPEIYWRAIMALGAWPRETVIVEDSLVGLAAAGNTGANILEVEGPEDVTLDAIFRTFAS
jgi:beta-phosphoglucomutase-like phosphatase (HAD superfamily)